MPPLLGQRNIAAKLQTLCPMHRKMRNEPKKTRLVETNKWQGAGITLPLISMYKLDCITPMIDR